MRGFPRRHEENVRNRNVRIENEERSKKQGQVESDFKHFLTRALAPTGGKQTMGALYRFRFRFSTKKKNIKKKGNRKPHSHRKILSTGNIMVLRG